MSRLTRIAIAAALAVVASFACNLWADEPAADNKSNKGDEVEEKLDTSGLSDEQRIQVERILKEQAESAKKLETHREAAPFQQTAEIRLPSGEGKILGFCVLSSGELVAISGASQEYGEGVLSAITRAFGSGSKPATSRVQWLDPSGKPLRSANLDFLPMAVNAAPDGSVFVVGAGKIAKFDAKGEKLFQKESPHLAKAVSNRDKFAEEMMERHREEIAQLEEQETQYAEALKELQAKKADTLTPSEKAQLNQAKVLTAHFTQQLKARRALTQETVVAQALTRLQEIHRIAIADDHVFIITREATGYGFCMWRMNQQLEDAKRIMSGLSGCCGQMDIQVIGKQLVIAENSRHRVVVADFDGKSTLNFGNSNRTDITKGFGGCCNPMNTCGDAQGFLLTSESNGLVKRYSPKGEFQAVVGIARVTEGCKNSSIGIAPDGSSLYYFDVTKGEILVLKKKA